MADYFEDEISYGVFNEFDFTSSAIGVGAITITKDGFVVLIRRALWTGEAAGKIDRPGGHPEPDEALKVYLKRFHNVLLDRKIEPKIT